MPLQAKERRTAQSALSDLALEIRQKLGLTQAAMGRLLGVTVTTVAHWESGHRKPGKVSVLRMLELCSDDNTRREFAVKFEAARRAEMGGDNPDIDKAEESVLKNFSDAATGINILYETALAGNPGAAQELSHLAEIINKRAGDWRRMKYRKK